MTDDFSEFRDEVEQSGTVEVNRRALERVLEKAKDHSLQNALDRYAHSVIEEATQRTRANRHPTVELTEEALERLERIGHLHCGTSESGDLVTLELVE